MGPGNALDRPLENVTAQTIVADLTGDDMLVIEDATETASTVQE